ncbi:hypothetical protein LJC58_00110 [Lachnospiraceae bacterium OttesenSCG-928-D06]|nr:hypothetical protein [Lachnospiraceae bacterium OttesenSCG-928-D06]
MIFKCKNCGGNVLYHPEKKAMCCPYCDSINKEEPSAGTGDIHVCPDCGGSLLIEEHTSASRCPYCENYIIFEERTSGSFTPKFLIPFQYSRDRVKQLMKDKFKKATFAPTGFLSEVKLNSMEGTYVPFWLYDYDVKGLYEGEGQRVRTWTQGDMEYTETSFFHIQRDMDVKFQKIPVDASIKMSDHIMDLMEPYEYGQLVPFKPEYMSGFQGEKYNMYYDAVSSRAQERAKRDSKTLLHQSINGYINVRALSEHIGIRREEAAYALLPVWVYTYEYNGKEYPFYINGQTGKIVGKTPVSTLKVMAYGGTLWGILTAIMGMLYFLTNL